VSTPAGPIVRRSPAHRGVVLATAELTPRMRRITVRADALKGTTVRPAQDVEVLLREATTGRRVKRRYTIRQLRCETGEIDLDVLLHGAGPGSSWGAAVAPGDELEFQGPRGKLQLVPADWHLLVGDESALPAIAAISEALPATEPAVAVIEVDGPADELPVEAETHWVHRAGSPPGGAELLSAAVRGLALPSGAGHAYLMGETRAMVALRALLEERGVPHESIFVKGYWNLGRPDRIAGRSPTAPALSR
jgi:NADPH-dependent ferric siderophore reductase